jgi:ketosteroid isomerase-like protein
VVPEVPAAIRRYFDGLNNEDWEDFAAVWTEDAELIGVGARPRKGRDDVMTYYSTVLVPYPVHRDDPYAIHVCGDVVTVEIAFTGETHEGVPVEFEAVDVFTLRDGRICRLTTWYDLDRVRKLVTRSGAPERRLRTLVAAAAGGPFYRRRFEELGLDPEQVAADLTLLPPTLHADLAAASADFQVAPPESVRHVLALDGFVLPLTAADVEEIDAALANALALAGVTAGDALLPLSSHRGLAVAAAKLGARLVVPGTPDAVGAAAAGRATVLFASAHADVAAFRARANELGADLRTLRLVVGTVSDAAGWPHARLYGTPATGVVAAACRQGDGLHVLESHILEIVGPGGAPVEPGAEGDVLVTPLGRRGAPLLRLATGARGAFVAGACACGSPLPRIGLAP